MKQKKILSLLMATMLTGTSISLYNCNAMMPINDTIFKMCNEGTECFMSKCLDKPSDAFITLRLKGRTLSYFKDGCILEDDGGFLFAGNSNTNNAIEREKKIASITNNWLKYRLGYLAEEQLKKFMITFAYTYNLGYDIELALSENDWIRLEYEIKKHIVRPQNISSRNNCPAPFRNKNENFRMTISKDNHNCYDLDDKEYDVSCIELDKIICYFEEN